jgi:hypothetical protein
MFNYPNEQYPAIEDYLHKNNTQNNLNQLAANERNGYYNQMLSSNNYAPQAP